MQRGESLILNSCFVVNLMSLTLYININIIHQKPGSKMDMNLYGQYSFVTKFEETSLER